MIITKVIEYDKMKVLVQIDEHFMFQLYKTELRKYNLLEGGEVSPSTYKELVEEVLAKRVKLRAMKLLEKRPYTRDTLKRKLLDGKYPEELVEEALGYVEKFGYVDDFQYSLDYMHTYAQKRSKKQISMELMRKGVSKSTLDSAWMQFEESDNDLDECAQIKAILLKKRYNKDTADYKEKCKIMQYLYRKGYDLNCIQNCMQFDQEYGN